MSTSEWRIVRSLLTQLSRSGSRKQLSTNFHLVSRSTAFRWSLSTGMIMRLSSLTGGLKKTRIRRCLRSWNYISLVSTRILPKIISWWNNPPIRWELGSRKISVLAQMGKSPPSRITIYSSQSNLASTWSTSLQRKPSKSSTLNGSSKWVSTSLRSSFRKSNMTSCSYSLNSRRTSNVSWLPKQ